jgi:hypothetical protein
MPSSCSWGRERPWAPRSMIAKGCQTTPFLTSEAGRNRTAHVSTVARATDRVGLPPGRAFLTRGGSLLATSFPQRPAHPVRDSTGISTNAKAGLGYRPNRRGLKTKCSPLVPPATPGWDPPEGSPSWICIRVLLGSEFSSGPQPRIGPGCLLSCSQPMRARHLVDRPGWRPKLP